MKRTGFLRLQEHTQTASMHGWQTAVRRTGLHTHEGRTTRFTRLSQFLRMRESWDARSGSVNVVTREEIPVDPLISSPFGLDETCCFRPSWRAGDLGKLWERNFHRFLVPAFGLNMIAFPTGTPAYVPVIVKLGCIRKGSKDATALLLAFLLGGTSFPALHHLQHGLRFASHHGTDWSHADSGWHSDLGFLSEHDCPLCARTTDLCCAGPPAVPNHGKVQHAMLTACDAAPHPHHALRPARPPPTTYTGLFVAAAEPLGTMHSAKSHEGQHSQ